MKKIVIEKEKIKTTIKKVLPYVIIGGVVVAAGCVIYRKGYSNGFGKGADCETQRIARHLSNPAGFLVTSYANGINTADKFTYISGTVCKTEEELSKCMQSFYGDSITPEIADKCCKLAKDFFTNVSKVPHKVTI